MLNNIQSLSRLPSSILLVTVLVLVTLVVTRGINKGEFNINVDEGNHAVAGFYFADFLSDLPLAHPIQYTYHYYAQYPALALIHWPPLFHFVEGIMFLLLGPSVVTARLTILLFALLGLCFWFKIVSELQNKWGATVSTFVLALLPSLLLYEKAVMLEVPALALCIAASYFWIQYLRQGASQFLYWFALFAGLALLTKQNSIYLAVFCLLTIVAERKWDLFLRWATVRAFGIFLLIVGPFYMIALNVSGRTISDNVFVSNVHGMSPLAYYWYQLPGQLGVTLLVLSVIGIATSRWWARRESIVIMLAWIISCYMTFTFFAGKEPRYILYWLPPFVYFAVCPLVTEYRIRWIRPVEAVVLLVLLAICMRSAWIYERPYVSGYASLARDLIRSNESGIILYDGELSENFIFFLRKYDPARRFLVMRKALYVTRISTGVGSRELVHTQAEVQGLIDRYGIKHIIVSEKSPLFFEAQKILRQLLQSPQFRLVERFPIETNIAAWRGGDLLLYENTSVMPRSERWLRLEMLTMNRNIVVPLDDLLGR